MGYLGLSGPAEKQDNLVRRIFWPGDSAADVDMLGQRGFWICALVGTVSFGVFLANGHWVLAVLTLLFFWLGGVGVREHSTSAAVLVAGVFLLNQAASLMAGIFPGVIAIGSTVLLLTNIRGTQIAARWAKRGDQDLFPERMGDTWRDKLVDQMPARVWPKARVVFFSIAGIYILLAVLGTVALARHRGRGEGAQQEQAPASIVVKPAP
jgi:hypothetical protein